MWKQKFVLLCGRNVRSCHWEVFCKVMFFFIRSFYCGYGLTPSGRKYYHDRKLLISQKKIWGKSINWHTWKQKFVLLCGWKTCGSKIKSTKANNIWNKIKLRLKSTVQQKLWSNATFCKNGQAYERLWTGLVTLVLLMWEWMGPFSKKSYLLVYWGYFCRWSWIGALIFSLLFKLPLRKLKPWLIALSFFLLRLLIIS